MSENKQFDIRDLSTYGAGALLAGAAGLGIFIYILPLLASVVWTGVYLIGGLIVGGVLLSILTSKKFWRLFKIASNKLAKMLTFWIIEWDEFILQEMEIEQAKKDREVIKEQSSKLYGQVSQKDEELGEAQAKLRESKGLISELQSQGRPDDDAEIELYVNDVTRSEDFINTIGPLREQIADLAKMCDRVYKETSLKIRDAENELKIQKLKFESLTAGQTAMDKALSIFQSDNADVALAKETGKRKIGEKIGSIRTTLDIIRPMMDERALKDKVKVKLALEQMRTVNIDVAYVAPKIESKQFGKLLN